VELEWSRPSDPQGELLGYRLRYGPLLQIPGEIPTPPILNEEHIDGAHVMQHRIQGLGKQSLLL
jgi:hypothetical protein